MFHMCFKHMTSMVKQYDPMKRHISYYYYYQIMV